MAPLPPRDLRHPWVRYQFNRYDEVIVHSYEQRLETIWGRAVNRRRLFEVRAPLVREFMLEFFSTCRMIDTEMGLDVADTLFFQLSRAKRRMTWRQFILALGLHSEEEMVEAGFGAYWSGSERVIPNKEDLKDYWMEISFDKDFLGPAPSYVHIRDPVRRLCHRMIACSISAHFGLVSDQVLRGLSVVVNELLVIDLHELDRLNIYLRFGDTWAWVAPGPERQQAAAAGTPGAAEDAPTADKGAQALCRHLSHCHPLLSPGLCHRGSRRRCTSYDRVLWACKELLRALLPSTSATATRSSALDYVIEDQGGDARAFNSTLVGSSWLPYQRRVRPKIGDASTSTTPHTDDHPDP
ncbi:hypothetical protein Tco_0522904 [Tanacetum coccineum]